MKTAKKPKSIRKFRTAKDRATGAVFFVTAPVIAPDHEARCFSRSKSQLRRGNLESLDQQALVE